MEMEVNTEKMRNYAGKELEIKGKLEGVCTSLQICQRDLRTSMSSAASISVDRALSKTYSNLVELVGKMGQMSGVMNTISGIYENTEEGIEKGKPARENIEKAKNIDLKFPEEESAAKKNPVKKTEDGLSWTKKLLAAWNEWKYSSKNNKLGFWSSFSGVLSSLCKLYGSESEAEWWSNLAGYTGGSLSLGSKLFKVLRPLAEKYGSEGMRDSLKGLKTNDVPEELKNLGIAGNILGLSSAFLNAYYKGSDSVADFLQQCPGLINAGKNLVMDFKTFASSVEKNEYIKKVANPIVAALSMASYATGEIMKLSGDDHRLTADELADLLTDTGFAGAKSLLSASTFGIVDIDTESFTERIHKNQDAFLDIVMDMNISNQAKIFIVTSASPVIAAGLVGVSAQEMLGDFLGNIYQSARSVWAY